MMISIRCIIRKSSSTRIYCEYYKNVCEKLAVDIQHAEIFIQNDLTLREKYIICIRTAKKIYESTCL